MSRRRASRLIRLSATPAFMPMTGGTAPGETPVQRSFTSQLGDGSGSIIRSNGRLASDRALRYVESIRWLAPTFCRRTAPAVS
jgi:hypothetical protein